MWWRRQNALRIRNREQTNEPAEAHSPSNPRAGLVEPNSRSARVCLASFSPSVLLKARHLAAISETETCSLRRIFFSSPLSAFGSSLLNTHLCSLTHVDAHRTK